MDKFFSSICKNKKEAEILADELMLNKAYKDLLFKLIEGDYNYIIADELAISDRTFYRRKKDLKHKILEARK